MIDDFSDLDVIVAPSAEQLKPISELAEQAYSLMKIVDELEASLKVHKAELMSLTHKAIPDAMAAAGTSEFKTDRGVKISVKEVMHGSLPKDEIKRAAAIRWLTEHGGTSIIKSELVCEFEKGEGNQRKKNQAAELLADLGVAFQEVDSVHHSTLCAFAREKVANGEELATELLGLYAGRVAKVEKA